MTTQTTKEAEQEYLVEWTIELSATSPEEAANKARLIQLDRMNMANHFYVTPTDSDEREEVNADLSPVRESTPEEEAYRAQAKAEHHTDSECEIDENAIVSVSEDGGAYVQAWVWVYDKETEEEPS